MTQRRLRGSVRIRGSLTWYSLISARRTTGRRLRSKPYAPPSTELLFRVRSLPHRRDDRAGHSRSPVLVPLDSWSSRSRPVLHCKGSDHEGHEEPLYRGEREERGAF